MRKILRRDKKQIYLMKYYLNLEKRKKLVLEKKKRNTEIYIQVDYDINTDDIKLFADYIMDLDENEHSFYFIYC